MTRYLQGIALSLCLLASLVTGSPMAAETITVATLKLTAENSGIFFGWHEGKGVLSLQDGSEYEVTMDAYSLLDFGFGQSTMTGRIYNLKSAADFPGVYSSSGSASAFENGEGEAVYTSEKKVRMELTTVETGYRAGLNFGSATFRLGKNLKGPRTPPPVAKAVPTTPVKVTPLPAAAKPPAPKTTIKKVVARDAVPAKLVMKKPTQYVLTFGFNKSRLSRAMDQTLDSVIKDWKGKEAVFHIIGHADKVGSKTYNSKLSQKRADAVKSALNAKGIPARKIVAVGVGHTVPAAATQEGQRLRTNRRVVVTVLPPK